MVSWFSGLFFLGRIFVYHQKAMTSQDAGNDVLIKLCTSAAKRVWYIIVLPALCVTVGAGTWLMMHTGAYKEGWFHLKLLLIIVFLFYNLICGRIRKKLKNGEHHWSSLKLRLFNEIPFLFLVSIVFTVYYKSFFSGVWALTVLCLIVLIAALLYYILRKRNV